MYQPSKNTTLMVTVVGCFGGYSLTEQELKLIRILYTYFLSIEQEKWKTCERMYFPGKNIEMMFLGKL